MAVQALLDPVAKLTAQLQRGAREPASGDMLTIIQAQVARLDAGRIGAQVGAVARLIAGARHVHVMGFGLSAHVAGLLVLGLQPFHPGVNAVVEFGGTEVAAGRLMAIGSDDLLVALSFPRYAKDAVRLCRYARDRGAKVVAITDSPASPLAAGADAVIFAPAEHPALSSSYTAAVAVIETLISAVMLSDPANAERAALLGDAISGYLHSA
jgi:DNA-binding MurR/RpiR family transcriptional regulator